MTGKRIHIRVVFDNALGLLLILAMLLAATGNGTEDSVSKDTQASGQHAITASKQVQRPAR